MQVIVGTFIMAVASTALLDGSAAVRAIRTLENAHATMFSIVYPDAGVGRPSVPTEGLDAYLTRTLDGSTPSHSLVVGNYFSDASVTHPVVVGIGGFLEFWGIDDPRKDREPGIWVGSNVREYRVGDTIDLGPHVATVRGQLPSGTAVFDPWNGLVDLDDSLVLTSSYAWYRDEAVGSGAQASFEEITQSLVMSEASPREVETYVRTVSQSSDYHVLPRTAEGSRQYFRDQIFWASIQLAMGLGLLVVAGIGIVSMATRLVRSNVRDFAIRRLSGATVLETALRVVIAIGLGFAVPAVVVFVGLGAVPLPEFGRLGDLVPAFVIGVAVLVSGTAWWASRIVRKADLAQVVREER
ncbi:hypothetical protein [Promicromonospora sp. NFX87]|uniref:hypothetical protein n=1 Tax=Promicromonospora sp. NFX87 TaxID=3402691 RepID=UPI003AFAA381